MVNRLHGFSRLMLSLFELFAKEIGVVIRKNGFGDQTCLSGLVLATLIYAQDREGDAHRIRTNGIK